jgi:hypothetical protein
MERRLARGQVRIEQRRSFPPIARVHGAHGFARSAGRKVLAVRAGHVGSAEKGRERMLLLGVDDYG